MAMKWKSVRRTAVGAKDANKDQDQDQETISSGHGHRLPGFLLRRAKADEEPVAHSHSWTNGASLTTKGVSLLILAAIACGPAALATSHSGSGQQGSSQATSTSAAGDPQESAAAGETGLEVVQAWLSATKDDHAQLDALMGASNSDLGEEPVDYSDVQVASSTPSEVDGVWTVIVTAMVPSSTASASESDAASAEPTDAASAGEQVRMAWQVPVKVEQGGSGLESSAVAWPAPTTLSQVGTGTTEGYGATLSTSSPVGEAVQELLTAYVTGGDVTRVISPSTELETLPAGVYSAASLTSLTAEGWKTDWSENPPEGQTVQVLAVATLTSSSQAVSTSSWALTLKVRAGRWEVSSVDGAPASVESSALSSATSTPEGDQ